MDALQLLDYDCWRLVFQKLDAEDLLSCRQICKPFHQLLDEQRFQVKWKFHLVLPLFFEQFKTKLIGQWEDFSWKDLHNIRLACQSWRHSVDQYASEIYKPSFSLWTTNFPLATCLYSVEKIEEFLQKFGMDRNPFPARTVFISMNAFSFDPTQLFTEKVTALLEGLGRNILNLQLCLGLQFHDTDYFFVYNLMKTIISHVPNLTTFRLSCFNYEDYDGLRERDDPHQLATLMEESPLSDLPKLQALQIEGVNEAVEKYLVEKYALQLTHFQGRSQPNLQLFGNLKKLSLEIVDVEDTLDSLRFLQSPLTHLEVNLDGPLFLNMAKVLRNLQHLPIDTLKIRLYGNVEVGGDLQLEEYMNESIQTLRIKFANYYGMISFNFLQALTKLERLKLKVQGGLGEITNPEHVVVNLRESMMAGPPPVPYQSNVWEKVPSLKTLKASWEGELIFTREEYERIRMNAE